MDRLQASLSWARWIASCTVRPCQHSRSWLHRAIFSLVALVLAGRVHTLPMPALDSDLVPFCSRGQSIEIVVAEYDCGYLGSASVCRRCLRFWCGLFLSLPQSFADTTSQIPWVGSVVSSLVSKSLSCSSSVLSKPVAWTMYVLSHYFHMKIKKNSLEPMYWWYATFPNS